MITCTRKLTFESGHRVLGHENKCASMHGHSYKAFITARGDLDSIGRVVDFSVLKERIGGWIDQYWDHGFILSKDDTAAIKALREFTLSSSRGQRLYILPTNPTAENLANYLLVDVAPRLMEGTGVEIVRVVIWETENCKAEASL